MAALQKRGERRIERRDQADRANETFWTATQYPSPRRSALPTSMLNRPMQCSRTPGLPSWAPVIQRDKVPVTECAGIGLMLGGELD